MNGQTFTWRIGCCVDISNDTKRRAKFTHGMHGSCSTKTTNCGNLFAILTVLPRTIPRRLRDMWQSAKSSKSLVASFEQLVPSISVISKSICVTIIATTLRYYLNVTDMLFQGRIAWVYSWMLLQIESSRRVITFPILHNWGWSMGRSMAIAFVGGTAFLMPAWSRP